MIEYKNKIIREYRLYKTMDICTDHNLSKYISMLGQKLGERGRFIVKQKGINGMIAVLAEADEQGFAEEVVAEFEEYLSSNGYIFED